MATQLTPPTDLMDVNAGPPTDLVGSSNAPAKPSALSRFSGALAESAPLSAHQAPAPGEQAPPLGETLKNFFMPGEGKDFESGDIRNLVHAIPGAGPGLYQILKDADQKNWPEMLGHMTGLFGVGGTQSAPAAQENTIGVGAPRYVPPETVGQTKPLMPSGLGTKLAASVPTVTPTMADIGGMISPRIGHALRMIGRLQERLGTSEAEAPETPAATAPQPSAAPAPAENLRTKFMSKQEAAREARANDLAEFLHQNGEGVRPGDAAKMGPAEWKLANQGVNSMRGIADKATAPSPATIKLTMDKLAARWGVSDAEAATRARLPGNAYDIAQRLKIEMGQGE